MEEETITIKATLSKELNSLARLMGELGFSKISYNKDLLTVEKIRGHDLRGRPFLEYRMLFKPDSIEFTYNVPPKKNKRLMFLELLPTFLSVLQVAEDYYQMPPSEVYGHINDVVKDLLKMVNKDSAELSTSLTDIETKHGELSTKYDDLVRSSEANAKLLMECERRRDELAKRVERLTKMSDDSLRESLYDWIKIHSGTIDVTEFSKTNAVSVSRVEEGLNSLIAEGFIRRRMD